jgi:hypothetical protein
VVFAGFLEWADRMDFMLSVCMSIGCQLRIPDTGSMTIWHFFLSCGAGADNLNYQGLSLSDSLSQTLESRDLGLIAIKLS